VRSKVWKPTLEAAGVPYQVPYHLPHSFASLLLHEGRSVIYVARQLGHDATLTLKTYGHVIDELEDQPQIPAEDAIPAAREKAAGDRRASRATTVVAAPPLGGL
jgi:integrase